MIHGRRAPREQENGGRRRLRTPDEPMMAIVPGPATCTDIRHYLREFSSSVRENAKRGICRKCPASFCRPNAVGTSPTATTLERVETLTPVPIACVVFTPSHLLSDTSRSSLSAALQRRSVCGVAHDASCAGIVSPAEVHLVRRLASECRMRQHAIVFVDQIAISRHTVATLSSAWRGSQKWSGDRRPASSARSRI